MQYHPWPAFLPGIARYPFLQMVRLEHYNWYQNTNHHNERWLYWSLCYSGTHTEVYGHRWVFLWYLKIILWVLKPNLYMAMENSFSYWPELNCNKLVNDNKRILLYKQVTGFHDGLHLLYIRRCFRGYISTKMLTCPCQVWYVNRARKQRLGQDPILPQSLTMITSRNWNKG